MKRKMTMAGAVGVGILVAPVIGGLALRDVCTWDNTSGGNWNEPTNWSPQEVPDTSGESASIPDDGFQYTVELDTDPILAWLANDNPLATINLNDRTLTLEDAGASTNSGVIAANDGLALLSGDLENEPGGEIQVPAGQTLVWDDDDDPVDGVVVINDGTITVNPEAGASDTILRFETDVELTGEGEVVLGRGSDYAQFNTLSGVSITHDEDHTIRGKGNIRVSMINTGSIVADSDDQLRIVPGVLTDDPDEVTFVNASGGSITALSYDAVISNASRFRNEGFVHVHAGRSLEVFDGDYVQTAGGVTRADGTVDVHDGVFDLQSGSLRGHGLIQADLEVNGGVIFPGYIFEAGTLDVSGSFTIHGSGVFVDLASETDFDQINAGGDVVVAGTLYVYAIEQYIPPEQQEFVIITGDTVAGEFDTVYASGVYDIAYNPDNVTLTVVTPPKLADVNGDGVVNVLDFLELLQNWGPCPGDCPPCYADINYDCVVDVVDFLALLANWDPMP
jgi:hypothetical protein